MKLNSGLPHARLVVPMPPMLPDGPSKIIQFDWRRQWRRRVMPHLELPQVRFAVELGMEMFDQDWTWEQGPHAIGLLTGERIVKGKLSWYRPWGRCHWISFFACAIGVLNYPQLDWRFLSGDGHTVPVGYAEDGEPFVVMDILHFDRITAEASIEWTRLKVPNAPKTPQWDTLFELYRKCRVPELKAIAASNDGIAGRRRQPARRAASYDKVLPLIAAANG